MKKLGVLILIQARKPASMQIAGRFGSRSMLSLKDSQIFGRRLAALRGQAAAGEATRQRRLPLHTGHP